MYEMTLCAAFELPSGKKGMTGAKLSQNKRAIKLGGGMNQ
jgi:hypothetical protein